MRKGLRPFKRIFYYTAKKFIRQRFLPRQISLFHRFASPKRKRRAVFPARRRKDG